MTQVKYQKIFLASLTLVKGKIMFKPRMTSIGDSFPHFTLQGVDKDNNFIEVSVSKEYEPLKHDYTVIYFYH